MNFTCSVCSKVCANGTGLAAHMKKHSNQSAVPAVANGSRFSATLFSVIAGDVHIRGCEFNGGFLVVSGDTLQQHASLAEAIAAAQVTVKIPDAPKVEPETHSAY